MGFFSKPQHDYSAIPTDCLSIIFEYHLQSIDENFMEFANEEELNVLRELVTCYKFEERRCDVSQFGYQNFNRTSTGMHAALSKPMIRCNGKASSVAVKRNFCSSRGSSSSQLPMRIPRKKRVSQLFLQFLHKIGAESPRKRLLYIDISRCDYVTSEAFPLLRSVQFLRMDSLPLQSLGMSEFKHLKNLKALSMKDCRQISGDVFSVIPHLKELDISGCFQSSIKDEHLTALQNLKSLNMSGCFQSTLSTASLSSLINLEKLIMYYCSQKSIQVQDLEQMPSLKSFHYGRPEIQSSLKRQLTSSNLQQKRRRRISC